jgi:hypothetical protein
VTGGVRLVVHQLILEQIRFLFCKIYFLFAFNLKEAQTHEISWSHFYIHQP